MKSVYLLIWIFCNLICLCAIPENGLIAYYPFNKNAHDESGYGNNGIVNETILSTDRFNVPESSYLFSGENSYITIPSQSVNNLQNGSICAYFLIFIEGVQHSLFDNNDF
ncbi:MAG TPA: hypothetical protein PKJ08_13380 [Candidatus Cloacimonadota bacterium]|nr:hypothetical protein [Candidatus Cloacimonadota bacterium]